MFRRMLVGAAVTIMLFAGVGCARAPANEDRGAQSVFVGLSQQRLVTTNETGQLLTYTPAGNVAVTIDGRAGNLGELKPGMKLRIVAQADAPTVAVRVDAETSQ